MTKRRYNYTPDLTGTEPTPEGSLNTTMLSSDPTDGCYRKALSDKEVIPKVAKILDEYFKLMKEWKSKGD